MMYHIPVLLQETINCLDVHPNCWYVDATLGGGGHTQAILERGGNVIGLDQDREAIEAATQQLRPRFSEDRFLIVQANFRDIGMAISHYHLPISGVLFDLGVSSHQLDARERGFSFHSDNLDMRMNPEEGISAGDFLSQLGEQDIAQLLQDLGEERYARLFAKVIVKERLKAPINSGKQLADILWKASPASYRYGHIHPATRTFQALRMAVNEELPTLSAALTQSVDLLKKDGRIVVISFHSLEDRVVKRFFATHSGIMVPSKKLVTASADELAKNPRARSAKLRFSIKG